MKIDPKNVSQVRSAAIILSMALAIILFPYITIIPMTWLLCGSRRITKKEAVCITLAVWFCCVTVILYPFAFIICGGTILIWLPFGGSG